MRQWKTWFTVLLATAATIGVLWLLFTWLPGIVSPLLFLTAVFLILLVLVQKGRGGGLAGAFGGLGGQSAFGTKAGDLFTKITVGVAAFWIIACVVSIKALSREQSKLQGVGSGQAQQGAAATTGQGGEQPADDGGS